MALVQEEAPSKNSEELSFELAVDQLQSHLDVIKRALPSMKKMTGISSEMFQEVERKVADYALSLKTSKLSPEYLEAFFKTPYFLVPAKKDSWNLFIPRFIDMQVGYLERQTESWNVFLINRYTEWLGGIPDALKKEIGLKTPLELKLEGDILFGSADAQKEAWKKYTPFLKEQTKEGIKVNPKRVFELLAALVRDGVLPFSIKPIDKNDLVNHPVDFELRDYQKEGWDTFLQYSNCGFFWPPSAGKTFITLWALAHIKGPHLIVVPQLILKEQWEERIRTHIPDLKEGADYVVATYQGAIGKLMDRQWVILSIDECQHLPANNFSKLSMIKRKYTMGLSATPQREDGREEYIFALTGKPIGLSWDSLKRLGVIKSPTEHVWIVKNEEQRFKKLAEILQDEKKTVVFCDGIETGKMLAGRYNVPFVYGETKSDRLKTILEAPLVIVSRVGDQGISIPDIARVIEVKWLFGSRRQELQRFGRLLHGTESKESEHYIIMTAEEYNSDKKRLFSIMDKGFKIVLHKDEGTERIIQRSERADIPKSLSSPKKESRSEVAPQAVATPAPTGILALPGVIKNKTQMTKGQQEYYDFFLEHDGKFYAPEKLFALIGHGLGHDHDLPEMVRKGWIEEKTVEGRKKAFGTNMSVVIG